MLSSLLTEAGKLGCIRLFIGLAVVCSCACDYSVHDSCRPLTMQNTLVWVEFDTGATSTSELGRSESLMSMKKWSPRCLMSYSTPFSRGSTTFHLPSGWSADKKRVSDVTAEPAGKKVWTSA